jgi:hypothetical protein
VKIRYYYYDERHEDLFIVIFNVAVKWSILSFFFWLVLGFKVVSPACSDGPLSTSCTIASGE